MEKWKLRVKDKILIYTLPFIILALVILTFIVYKLANSILMNNYHKQRQLVHSNVINSIHLIDAGYRMLDNKLENDMERAITIFKNEFEKSGGNPERVNLEEIKKMIDNKYDLLIIDSKTTIIKSTISQGLNFNFMEFDKSVGEQINLIRLSDKIMHERIRTNVGTGLLSKFTYLASSDHRYLLEISYSEGGLGDIVKDLEPFYITTQLVKSNPIVSGIRIFDVYGYEFVNSGENYKPTKESLAIVNRAKKEQEFEVTENNITKSYIFVDLKNNGQAMSDNSKVIEITFDNMSVYKDINKITYSIFFIGLITSILITVMLSVISKRITNPITELSNAVKFVAKGDYNVVVNKTSKDEIGDFADIFNIMTAKIKENFAKIEGQKLELEGYNENLEKMVSERTKDLLVAQSALNEEKLILERILDETLSGYWDWDFKKNVEYFSPGYIKMLGYEQDEWNNYNYKLFDQIVHPEDLSTIQENLKIHLESKGREPFYCEVRFRHRDGNYVWVINAGHVVKWDDEDKPVRMVGCHINISNMKTLEKSLSEEREILKATLRSMGDGVITIDKNEVIKIINREAAKILGVKQEEAIGRKYKDFLKIFNENYSHDYENPIEKVFNTDEIAIGDSQDYIVDKEGKLVPIENIATPIKDEMGRTDGVVLVFRDYTENKEKQERIKYLSLHDQLTGLYNRRFFEEELKRLDIPSKLPLSLVMLDVNGLKLINDAFGHSMGDRVLQRVAEIIREECRLDDIIARFGGDEFVLLLPNTTAVDAESIMKRIDRTLNSENIGSFNISVSSGWSTKNYANENTQDIFKLAEDYMYRNKLSESKSMHYKTIDIITKTLHEKSGREKQHSERVANLCEELGVVLGYSQEAINELKTTGLMHDIGKIAIDLSILDKPYVLNELEWAEIQRHPELGYQILRSINEFAKLAEHVLAHHERWDGTGYPRRLKGEEIPVESRIIAIADTYDAMTSDRAYRKAMLREEAVKEIIKNSGTQFDPYLARIFVEKVLQMPWEN